MPSRLSEQETKIVQLTIDGLTDKEVARESGLALSSVRTYWKRIRQKTGCPSRAAVIAMVMRAGIDGHLPGLLTETDEAPLDASALEAILEAVPAAILVFDAAGICRRMNRAAAELMGASKSLREVHEVDQRDADPIARRVLKSLNGSGGSVVEASVRRSDGSTASIEWHAQRVPNSDLVVGVGKWLSDKPSNARRSKTRV